METTQYLEQVGGPAIKIVKSTDSKDLYEISPSFLVNVYHPTREITLINGDDGYELLLQDFEEATKLAWLLGHIVETQLADDLTRLLAINEKYRETSRKLLKVWEEYLGDGDEIALDQLGGLIESLFIRISQGKTDES